MAKMRGAIVVDTEACKGCQLCVAACPMKILELTPAKVNHRGYPFVRMTDEWELCTGCASCATVCPDSCITVYRKREEQVLKQTPLQS